MTEASEPPRDELLALYKLAVDEYRFEVNLGWDRQKFFIGLNVTLIGALAGFAKLASPASFNGLIAGAFVMGAATSSLGAFVVWKTHGYYQ